ncbi:MAG: holo-ACP synthase [Acidobacteriia bacterium]|nr:holo-ACP synthase [Terriglobia bacterium]
MILGIGFDLLEVSRLVRALGEHGSRFEDRVFTSRELADCSTRADRTQALAARFAAKEACLKALGTGWSQGLTFQQVEVIRTEDGRPVLQLLGAARERADRMGVRRAHVTLTHQRGVAGAVVVLEGEPDRDPVSSLS